MTLSLSQVEFMTPLYHTVVPRIDLQTWSEVEGPQCTINVLAHVMIRDHGLFSHCSWAEVRWDTILVGLIGTVWR